MSFDRDTKADQVYLIIDPDERAAREAENGLRQFRAAMKMAAAFITGPSPCPLRHAMIMDLHKEALDGVHPLAGTVRNSPVTIGNAKHIPPRSSEVHEYLGDMIAYVNENWDTKRSLYLSAYVMWRLNWIHPFADGNGRTSRMISYLIFNMSHSAIFPGSPAIPDLIDDENGMRERYYKALESADQAYAQDGRIAIGEMETLIDDLLQIQLRDFFHSA